MKRSPDRLYELLPAVYRLRDAEQGYPLKALLQVINKQVDLVETDIARMYDNWFIETCEEWVVPYIADLVGYEMLNSSGEPVDPNDTGAKALTRVLAPRRDAANVIGYRRRKGSVALLELLAGDTTNLPARVVEFYRLLGHTQSVNFPHLKRAKTVNLRRGDALDLLGGPFERAGHTADVRRGVSGHSPGRYGIPNVGLFAWRMKAYSVTEAPAFCLEEAPECYTFSVLGNDTQLYNDPQAESDPSDIADELNLPTPIRRRAFEGAIVEDKIKDRDKSKHKEKAKEKFVHAEASEKYYGRSLSVFVADEENRLIPVPRRSVIPADLSDWNAFRLRRGYVAVDPKLGRIVFPRDRKPKYGVFVSYQYAFSADIGGGEYYRRLSQPAGAKIYPVGPVGPAGGDGFATIEEALMAWEEDKAGNEHRGPQHLPAAVIEIRDSGVYEEQLSIDLKAGEYLQIRAANRRRPVIRLLDQRVNRPDAFGIRGETGSRAVLDGLMITGRAVRISNPELRDRKTSGDDLPDIFDRPEEGEISDLCDVTIRHCTLVPGRSLHGNCEPRRPSEPSIRLEYSRARLKVEHSILGPIYVEANERAGEPSAVDVSDSILDATRENGTALGSRDGGLAYVDLTVARCTVIGMIRTHSIALAENSIFKGVMTVGRKQRGCVRFCYVTPGSRTPQRYECQPDMAERAARGKPAAAEARMQGMIDIPAAEIEKAKAAERMRVEPRFSSLRYGNPAYCQLSAACAKEISQGADDESEMGVFHDLYQPQRHANLRARLDEYTPAGAETAIIYVN